MKRINPDADTIYLTLSAFDIARLGKDELYSVAEQEYRSVNGEDIEILEMELIPFSIHTSEVEYEVSIIEAKCA